MRYRPYIGYLATQEGTSLQTRHAAALVPITQVRALTNALLEYKTNVETKAAESHGFRLGFRVAKGSHRSLRAGNSHQFGTCEAHKLLGARWT